VGHKLRYKNSLQRQSYKESKFCSRDLFPSYTIYSFIFISALPQEWVAGHQPEDSKHLTSEMVYSIEHKIVEFAFHGSTLELQCLLPKTENWQGYIIFCNRLFIKVNGEDLKAAKCAFGPFRITLLLTTFCAKVVMITKNWDINFSFLLSFGLLYTIPE